MALNNLAHLCGADRRGPRLDWRDLAAHSEGLICLTGAPETGLLSPLLGRAPDPAESLEALTLTRRLLALYPDRLYLELAFHGRPLEKLINRSLVALGERLELPLVATNAVRFARPEDALAHTALQAIAQGRTAEGLLGGSGRREDDLPQVALEATRSQAHLKSPQEMARLFGRLPAALEATVEIARRCTFRLPLATTTPPERRYGPALLFGLEPARGLAEEELTALVDAALPARFAATGRGEVPDDVRGRAQHEVRAVCASGVAELLLTACEVAQYCASHSIALAARGSATCSLVAWALGLVELCPLDL